MAWARLALVPAAVAINLTFLYAVVRNAPGEVLKLLEIHQCCCSQAGLLYFPSSLEDIRSLAGVLEVYHQQHPRYVLLLFSSAYLFKQVRWCPSLWFEIP